MIEKALVTGATGFIGKHLIELLLANQIGVRALIRDQNKSSLLPNHIDVISGDLTEPNTLVDICEDIDMVFHLGGYAHAWGDEISEAKKHHQINFQGTKNIVNEAIRSHVKRFIYFSSVKAVADTEACIDEQWDHPAHTAYGIAKREAEKYVLEIGRQTGLHVCILRPALVYGPNWKGNLASMLRAIDKGIFLPLPETHNKRSLVSIHDICQAAILAATNVQANGKIYFVTDGRYYSTYELYRLMLQGLGKQIPKWHMPLFIFKLLALIGDHVGKLMGRRMPFNSEALSKLFGSAQYNSEQIQKELGFRPHDDLSKALPEIIADYRAMKVQDIKSFT